MAHPSDLIWAINNPLVGWDDVAHRVQRFEEYPDALAQAVRYGKTSALQALAHRAARELIEEFS